MKDINKLEKIANNVRKNIIEMVHCANSGHPGGSLSCVEILTVIYKYAMNLNCDEKGNRIDKFVMSKGHASPAYYSILFECGFIPQEELKTFRKIDSSLEGHPSNKIPGVDVSSGSLGQGLSIANGMALAKKLSKEPGYVYCLLGDGELEEGQIWEALMTANKYNLDNLIVVVDNNGLQIDGTNQEVKKLEKLKEKFSSFGFNVINVNGHDIKKLIISIEKAKKCKKPTCIIAKTIKGKGVSFMENQVAWHGKGINDEDYEKAMKQLKGGNI